MSTALLFRARGAMAAAASSRSLHAAPARPAPATPSSSSAYMRNLRGEGADTALRNPVRQVYISQSSDVFTNLALEDWLYQHHDFDHKVSKKLNNAPGIPASSFFLLTASPASVAQQSLRGHRQAPEPLDRGRRALPEEVQDRTCPPVISTLFLLLRFPTHFFGFFSNSGGGTVFHDLGNINCTFFTRKSDYHRRHNLEIICSAIRRRTSLDVSVNDREDIVLDNTHKVGIGVGALPPCLNAPNVLWQTRKKSWKNGRGGRLKVIRAAKNGRPVLPPEGYFGMRGTFPNGGVKICQPRCTLAQALAVATKLA